jgi:hypothetical protein
MNEATMSMSGRVTVSGNGSAAEDSFKITASAPICNGSGSVTLTAKPNYRPSVSSKNGVSHNIEAGALVGLSNVSDYDVTIAKSATLAGQDCECEMSMQNIKSGQAGSLRISTNHEKLGDVSVTLAQKGSKVDGDTQGADRASVKLNLPMKDMISNDDVTASVEYDVPSQVATVNLGYTSGDVNVGLKSNVNLDNQSASHKATVNYSGIEGVGVSVEVDQDVAGKLSVTKDKYELRVPFSKDGGVNPDDVQLRMKWSQDL